MSLLWFFMREVLRYRIFRRNRKPIRVPYLLGSYRRGIIIITKRFSIHSDWTESKRRSDMSTNTKTHINLDDYSVQFLTDLLTVICESYRTNSRLAPDLQDAEDSLEVLSAIAEAGYPIRYFPKIERVR